ncbi:MAG: hypothetical protein ACIAQZ_14500 [Sedimentisphaeraceae bacterium JB056]
MDKCQENDILEITHAICEKRKKMRELVDNYDYSSRRFQIPHSCLDQIDDANVAISDYANLDWVKLDIGIKYLCVHGLFQMLFIQQDAMRTLRKEMELTDGDDEEIKKKMDEIRKIRNDVTGHPTDRGNGKKCYGICRSSLYYSKWNLTILGTDCREDRTGGLEEHNLYNIVKTQCECVLSILSDIIDLGCST